MSDNDHQINALMQMLSEANGREMQLRSVLGKMQGELTEVRAEVVRLKEEPPLPPAAWMMADDDGRIVKVP